MNSGREALAGQKVLIVEDNEDNRAIYTATLKHYGYTVLEADNGYTGVEIARQARPHLILMDLSMPILDGLEATVVLKASTETAAIPILMISAHTLDEDRDRARAAGCDGFVAKPCSPQRLVAEVSRFIEPIPSTPKV